MEIRFDFIIRVQCIPDDGTLGTNCIIRKQGVGGGNMEIKALSGIVAMDVGLDNQMVIWEIRWKQTMVVAILVNG